MRQALTLAAHYVRRERRLGRRASDPWSIPDRCQFWIGTVLAHNQNHMRFNPFQLVDHILCDLSCISDSSWCVITRVHCYNFTRGHSRRASRRCGLHCNDPEHMAKRALHAANTIARFESSISQDFGVFSEISGRSGWGGERRRRGLVGSSPPGKEIITSENDRNNVRYIESQNIRTP